MRMSGYNCVYALMHMATLGYMRHTRILLKHETVRGLYVVFVTVNVWVWLTQAHTIGVG